MAMSSERYPGAMTIKLDPALADLRTWLPRDCSIAKALAAVGPHSSFLILREALYGVRRFEMFVRRVGVTEAVMAARLKQLTEAGLLRREPYREPGSRTRYEYVLTEAGRDLIPPLLALMAWGDAHLQPDGGPLDLVDDATGEPVRIACVGPDGRERSPSGCASSPASGTAGGPRPR